MNAKLGLRELTISVA